MFVHKFSTWAISGWHPLALREPSALYESCGTSELPRDQVPNWTQKTQGKASGSGTKVLTLLTSLCILGALVVCHIAVCSEDFCR